MKKTIIGLIAAASMALPMAAFASTSIANLTFAGSSNITGGKSDAVTARLSVNLTGDSDVESVSFDYNGDSLDRTCVNVDDQLQSGYRTFDLDMTLPANTGNWDVVIKTYGIDGAGADQDCQGSPTDTMNFNDRITVVDDGSGVVNPTAGGTGTSVGSTNKLDAILASIAALIAKLGSIPTPAPTPVPTVSAACQAYAQASVATMSGVRNDANVRLQGFLLSQGASIPALAAGASFGFYGTQTAAALSWFQSGNHCV